jgi:hypothetical protein
MSDELRGADYLALVDLFDLHGHLVAGAGMTCARVSPASLPWLLEQRLIQLVLPAPDSTGEGSDAT